MVILVTGSRAWTDYAMILTALEEYAGVDDVTVRHGDAAGADKLAQTAAFVCGYEEDPMPADWNKYGKSAGPIRNVEMLSKAPRPDVVLAFVKPGSKGTIHCIEQARKREIHTRVFTPEGECLCGGWRPNAPGRLAIVCPAHPSGEVA